MKKTLIQERVIKDEERQTATETFSDKLDIYKKLIETRTDLNMSTDYVLATLDEKQKLAIVNMIVNSRIATRAIDNIIFIAERYPQEFQMKQWEKNRILEIKKEILMIYRERGEALVNMNRNIPTNFIIKVLTETPQLEEDQKEEEEDQKLKNKLAKWLKPKNE